MCWVVGGFGKKNLGRNFNCFAPTWDAKYPRNNLPGTLWYVWVYSVCLRCQGSLEELYIGSRAPKKKPSPEKTETLWISGDNYRESHKELGRVCNQYFHGGCYVSCIVFFRWRGGGSRMCLVVWEKAKGSILVFAAEIWTSMDKLHTQDHPSILGSKVSVVVSGVPRIPVLLGKNRMTLVVCSSKKIDGKIPMPKIIPSRLRWRIGPSFTGFSSILF